MTLVLASMSASHQIIVADRVLSMNGKPIHDDAYKIVRYVNQTQHYQFGVAYTGLAGSGRFNTLDWLMAALPSIFNPTTALDVGLTKFCEECTPVLDNLGRSDHPLSFIFSGRFYTKVLPGESRFRPFVTVISNCIDQRGEQTRSAAKSLSRCNFLQHNKRSRGTFCYGNLDAVAASLKEWRAVCRKLKNNTSPEVKVAIFAGYIKRASKFSSGSIGEDCLGLAILNGNLAEGFDIPNDPNKITKTMPHSIFAEGLTFANVSLTPFADHDSEDGKPGECGKLEWG